MVKVVFNKPVRFNGEDYLANQPFEVADNEVPAMLKAGAVVVGGKPKVEKKPEVSLLDSTPKADEPKETSRPRKSHKQEG